MHWLVMANNSKLGSARSQVTWMSVLLIIFCTYNHY